MRILVIDDIRNLRAEFAADHEVHVARNSQEAFDLIETLGKFDIMCFDHDLGGDDTTRPVVSMLEERGFLGNPVPIGHCIVHTANISGAAWIMSGLKAAGYDPVRVYAGDYFLG